MIWPKEMIVLIEGQFEDKKDDDYGQKRWANNWDKWIKYRVNQGEHQNKLS